jgi:hypothetical protein
MLQSSFFPVFLSQTVVAVCQGDCNWQFDSTFFVFLGTINHFFMVDQLKTIQLCQVVNLLKTTRKSADILKALFNKLIDEKSEDVLMKLTN